MQYPDEKSSRLCGMVEITWNNFTLVNKFKEIKTPVNVGGKPPDAVTVNAFRIDNKGTLCYHDKC